MTVDWPKIPGQFVPCCSEAFVRKMKLGDVVRVKVEYQTDGDKARDALDELAARYSGVPFKRK